MIEGALRTNPSEAENSISIKSIAFVVRVGWGYTQSDEGRQKNREKGVSVCYKPVPSAMQCIEHSIDHKRER